MILPLVIRKRLGHLRRAVCERVGVGRYSRPALHDLDRKLGRWLDFDDGFFVEAGAYDGVEQSNTYHLEKIRGWTGLLVEPVPGLAAGCRRNRSQPVVEAALVARGQDGGMVELHSAGLISTVSGALGSPEATAEHVRRGVAMQALPESPVLSVRGRALSSLLDEFGPRDGHGIDFLSLDVKVPSPPRSQDWTSTVIFPASSAWRPATNTPSPGCWSPVTSWPRFW